jgi:hypothetical protein
MMSGNTHSGEAIYRGADLVSRICLVFSGVRLGHVQSGSAYYEA